MMKLAILSDIHGNLEAFTKVLDHISDIDSIILLGDNIDYCPHSNEVVSLIKERLDDRMICSIWGNHEMMILRNDFTGFELSRGVRSAMYTSSRLTEDTISFLKEACIQEGNKSFMLGNKKFLAVHGSFEDPYWGTIEQGQDYSCYHDYDYVLSGHSHIPHCFEIYYSTEDEKRRNKKKTVFINPGSVGQPRNLNPLSQYAVLDTETEEICFYKVPYDIEKEQAAFSEEVDVFYKDRLKYGV